MFLFPLHYFLCLNGYLFQGRQIMQVLGKFIWNRHRTSNGLGRLIPCPAIAASPQLFHLMPHHHSASEGCPWACWIQRAWQHWTAHTSQSLFCMIRIQFSLDSNRRQIWVLQDCHTKLCFRTCLCFQVLGDSRYTMHTYWSCLGLCFSPDVLVWVFAKMSLYSHVSGLSFFHTFLFPALISWRHLKWVWQACQTSVCFAESCSIIKYLRHLTSRHLMASFSHKPGTRLFPQGEWRTKDPKVGSQTCTEHKEKTPCFFQPAHRKMAELTVPCSVLTFLLVWS